ncbi:MAG: cation diffusion facilitator family transporter [Pseudomonadota bacterium]
MSEREKTESTALTGVITCGLGFLANIVAVVTANSLVLLADFFNSLLEFLSITITWSTLRILRKDHRGFFDYGLGKIENVSSLFIGLFLLLSVLIMTYLIVYRFLHPVRLAGWGIWIGIFCTLIFGSLNAYLWIKSLRHRRISPSPIVDAQCRLFAIKTATNTLMFITFVSSISLRYHWVMYLDTLSSLISVGMMVNSSWHLIRHSIRDLLDRSIEEPLQMLINKQLVDHYDAYETLDGVRTRYSGQNIFIEIFIGFNPDQSFGEIQRVLDEMKKGLEADIPHAEVMIVPRALAAPVINRA